MINRCIIFTSKTCKDCFALSAHYNLLETEFKDISFEYIDVIEHPKLGEKHKIYTVPAVELYEDNQLVAEFKHGSSKQVSHISNFIKLHVELRKETK